MNKRYSFIMIIIVMALQIFLFNYFDDSRVDLTGFMILSGIYPNNTLLLFGTWYIFIAALTFGSLGFVKRYISGYGIYQIVREKARVKIGFRRVAALLTSIAGLSLLQVIFSVLFAIFTGTDQMMFAGNFEEFFILLGLYVLSNTTIVFIQMVLELYFSEQIALLTINIYVLFSVSLGGVLLTTQKMTWLLYLLIPNVGMYERSNLEESALQAISPNIAYLVLFLLLIILSMVSYRKLRNMDII